MLKRAKVDEYTFAYYSYVKHYGREPVDIVDWVDGVYASDVFLAIDIKTRVPQ